MGFLGLVPSEHSSGSSRRQGEITLTGNRRARRMLVESAWSYRFPARQTMHLKRSVGNKPNTEAVNHRPSWAGLSSLASLFGTLYGYAQHIREVSLNPLPIYVAIKQIFDMCVTEAPIRPVEVQVLDVPDARHQLDNQQIRQSGH